MTVAVGTRCSNLIRFDHKFQVRIGEAELVRLAWLSLLWSGMVYFQIWYIWFCDG